MLKKKIYKWLILWIGMFIAVVLFICDASQKEEVQEESYVQKEEIVGLFQIIGLESTEMEVMIFPNLSDILTWEDTFYMYDTLGYGELLPERSNVSLKESVSRKEFTEIYESFLEISKIDTTEIIFTYFGHVPQADRIATDMGNYDTSLAVSNFEYGKTYCAICCNNQILFIKDMSDKENKTMQSIQTTEIENEVVDIPEHIQIVFTNDNQQQPLRNSFAIKCDSDFTVIYGNQEKTYKSNKTITNETINSFFDDNSVSIIPNNNQSLYIKRADTGEWSGPYRGQITVYKKDENYWLVNQVSLEEYLYGVVPGEMPERFELEALKAQAVCARTYACNMICSDAYSFYCAHVDDSVNCQVYDPASENKKAETAVDETHGIVILDSYTSEESLDMLANVYYFSTSCGFTSGLEAWGEESSAYLQSVSTLISQENVADWDSFLKKTDVEAYDSGSNYFRWKAEISLPKNWKINIVKRENAGNVTKIQLKTDQGKEVITTENDIRRFLGKYIIKLTDKNNEAINNTSMLPSSWFTIEQDESSGKYILYGGGFGHGIGFCQYGAQGMAKLGMKYDKILQHYFTGIKLKKLV